MEGEAKKKKRIKRRKFIMYTGIGVGLVLGIGYFTRTKWRQLIDGFLNSGVPPYKGTTAPDIWFQVTPENEIILHSSKVEMGQGIFTGLAQIAADELEVDFDKIMVIHANTKDGPIDNFCTGSSTSIASLWMPMREMACCMREMIRIQAAKKWAVVVETVKIKNGVLFHGSQSMTFGEAVKDVTNWEIPEDKYLTLKDPKDYKYVGKPIARVDLKAKVFGDPIFGMDAEMDDMLYASVTRPPMVDATLKRCNSSVAEKMPGVVKVVKEKDFVGVVAESRTEANNARLALKCEWNVNKVWQMQDILDIIKVGAGCPYEIQSHGKAKKILDKAEKDGSIIKMEFNSPIGAHAQMEPCGAVAHYKDGKMEVKVSTQVVKLTRDQIADRLGISNDDVNIIPTYLGGGFGKRLQTPTATQTAVLAKAVDKPVKCFLDRKQEFQNDTFRPPTNHLLRAVLDGEGKIEAFEHNVSSGDVLFGSPLVKAPMEMILGSDFGAWRGGMIMYNDIPNFRAVSWRVSLPFATSSWRGLGLLANTFAIESFLDELALTSGKDPIQFRLDMCSDDEKGLRLQTVIREAAERSGYRNNTEDGIAMGFAACIDGNSVCAHVAEVSIVDNEIVVHKVTCVFDCGLVVNPDQVKAQCEGCITMGLSASLYEKMDLVDGVLSPMIYGDYKIAMMRHAPKVIDVVLIEGQSDPLPVGEPPLGPIGAAIGNAVKRLTGKRLTSLPLNLEES